MTTSPPTLDYQSPVATIRHTRMIPIVEALAHIAFGAVLPIVCFAMSAPGYPGVDQPWQSGQLRMYAGQIPRAACAWPFYPLLLYSIISLVMSVFSPALAASRFPLRLGIYTGIVLALQFLAIQAICLEGSGVLFAMLIAAAVVPYGLYELTRWLIRRYERGMRLVGVTLAAIAAALLLGTLALGRTPWLMTPGIVLLVVAPALTLASYLAVARVLMVNARVTRGAWLWIPWIAGYSAAWWASIECAMAQYAKLPKVAPSGCYVVTAAAGGHPRFVKSERLLASDGTVVMINRQLLSLKFAELFMAAACPNIHRQLRFAYDRVGPPIARCISAHPIFCDLAYCSLKPFEWGVIVMCHIARPRCRDGTSIA